MNFKKNIIPLSLALGSSFCIASATYVSYCDNTSIQSINQSSTNIESIDQEKQTKAFTKPTTLAELQKANPADIAALSSYDSREYGIVPPVKNQGSEGIC